VIAMNAIWRRSVGAHFTGKLDDDGFMQYDKRGLTRAQAESGFATTTLDQVPPDRALPADALRKLAQGERGRGIVNAAGACAD
jgi:hypothetical protein